MQRCHVIPERRGLRTFRMMGRHEEEAVKNRTTRSRGTGQQGVRDEHGRRGGDDSLRRGVGQERPRTSFLLLSSAAGVIGAAYEFTNHDYQTDANSFFLSVQIARVAEILVSAATLRIYEFRNHDYQTNALSLFPSVQVARVAGILGFGCDLKNLRRYKSRLSN